MVMSLSIFEYQTTGRARARTGWFGRPILQVEVRWTSYRCFDIERTRPLHTGLKWVDATFAHFQERRVFTIGPTFEGTE